MYFDELLPRLVKEGSDGNAGSSALCDTTCLQVQLIFMLYFSELYSVLVLWMHICLCSSQLGVEIPFALSAAEEYILGCYILANKVKPILHSSIYARFCWQLVQFLHFYNFSLFYVPCSILQALSKRIHYGKFVAEAKFQESPEAYTPAIIAQVCAFVPTISIFLFQSFRTK